ncbi:VOC family protein [Actinomadura decatromicini]|uniref:Glyoxalase n=1 Tax=Actinomadura decatromicini TaxID=2604572 RepID=A0A5D3FSC3_9ACTN|nr:VOC family protein [Actinomadura decatromicini]TYK51241.1 glyoxalase [Actinomadura decatromicini]
MISQLAYLGIASPKAEEWRDYATRLLGAVIAEDGADGAVRVKVDDRGYRIAVHPAERDELRYVGWDCGNETVLRSYVAELRGKGVDVRDGGADELKERQVAELYWFTDPFGNRHELVWGQYSHPNSFFPGRPMRGRFVTGDLGLGHIVLIVPNLDEANAFYADTLGFRLSDRVKSDIFNLRFYHCNGRHHSLAVAEIPGMTGINHLMLEVESFDDLGTAIDLFTADPEREILLSLGRHTNDLMTSIYVQTPSSMQIEYGHGGITVDDLTWVAGTHDLPSIWGHHRSQAYLDGPPGIFRTLPEAAE